MAIKRKTISIKKVRLVKPKYQKVLPKAVIEAFTEPILTYPEEITVTKKKKNRPLHKVKKAKKAKAIRKGPLILKSKDIQKLSKKKKQKTKKRKERKFRKPKATFKDAFTPKDNFGDIGFSDDIATWDTARESIVQQFYNQCMSIAFLGETPKVALKGADYAVEGFATIPGIEDTDTLANFLIENPVMTVFDDAYQVLYDAGAYILTSGRKGNLSGVDNGIEKYRDIIHYAFLAEQADGDYMENVYE